MAELQSAADDLPVSPVLDKLLNTRRLVLTGYLAVVAFVVVIGFWAGAVPLTSAAIAPGVVGVEGHRKQIQHLDGGIVGDILVRDGDRVTAGQTLVTLIDIDLESQQRDLSTRLIQTTAELARWRAEQQVRSDLDFPPWLTEHSQSLAALAAMDTQRDLHRARTTVLRDTLVGLELERRESVETARNAEDKLVTLKRKQSLIEAELAEYRRLETRGLVTRSQLFDLQKQQTDQQLEIDENNATIQSAAQKQARVASTVAELRSGRAQEAAERFSELRNVHASLQQQLQTVEDRIRRLRVESPISGYVINSKVNTLGGVIAPGQVIMEIMPVDERLLIESRVSPNDRDAVRVGQKAEVRFSAFARRATLPLEGRVTLISADSVVDSATQLPYYRTTVALIEKPQDVLPDAEIHPGMQVDVLIVTGERTILEYLLSPIIRSFNRALREE